MTIRRRHRLALSGLLAAMAMGTACGGGAGGKSTARPRAPEQRQPIAPRPRVRANPAVVLPQPNVVDHGTDFAAIAGSLLVFGRWLVWHHPDPALVSRAYQPGSPPARVVSSDVKELRRIGGRIVEVDRKPFEFTTISVTQNAVSLRLTEYLAHRELIGASGRVVERDAARTEYYDVSIMRANYEAPWRLNLVERRRPKIEVKL